MKDSKWGLQRTLGYIIIHENHLYCSPILLTHCHGPISNLSLDLEYLKHGNANKCVCIPVKAEIEKMA